MALEFQLTKPHLHFIVEGASAAGLNLNS